MGDARTLHTEQQATYRGSLASSAGVSRLLDHAGDWHRDRLVVLGNEGAGVVTFTVKSRTDRGVTEVDVILPPKGVQKVRCQGAVEVLGKVTGGASVTWNAYFVELEGYVEHAPPVDVLPAELPNVGAGGAFTDIGWLPPERSKLWIGWDGVGVGVDVRFVDAAGTAYATWRLPAVPGAPILHPPSLKLQARNTEAVAGGVTSRIVATWK